MWRYDGDTAELYHYGVKGMRWGHRKAKVYAEGASRKTFKRDLKAMHSRSGLKVDYSKDKQGNVKITRVHSSDGKVRGQKYARQLMEANNKRLARQRVASLAGMATVAAGAAYVSRLR